MAIAARTAMIATVTINSIRVKPVGRCMGTPFFCGSMIGNSGSAPQTFPTSGRNRRTYGTSAGILAELVHVSGARFPGRVVDPAKIVSAPNTDPHHPLYDVVTGRLTDAPADNIRVVGLPALPPGTVADGVDIIIRTRPQSWEKTRSSR